MSKYPEWRREGKWLVARLGRAEMKLVGDTAPLWFVNTWNPVDAHGGQSDTVEKAKRAAERKAKRLIGTQAWGAALADRARNAAMGGPNAG